MARTIEMHIQRRVRAKTIVQRYDWSYFRYSWQIWQSQWSKHATKLDAGTRLRWSLWSFVWLICKCVCVRQIDPPMLFVHTPKIDLEYCERCHSRKSLSCQSLRERKHRMIVYKTKINFIFLPFIDLMVVIILLLETNTAYRSFSTTIQCYLYICGKTYSIRRHVRQACPNGYSIMNTGILTLSSFQVWTYQVNIDFRVSKSTSS